MASGEDVFGETWLYLNGDGTLEEGKVVLPSAQLPASAPRKAEKPKPKRATARDLADMIESQSSLSVEVVEAKIVLANGATITVEKREDA